MIPLWSGRTLSTGHVCLETSILSQDPGVLRLGERADHEVEILSDSPVTCRVDVSSSTTDPDLTWALGRPWKDSPELLPPVGRQPTREYLISPLTLDDAYDESTLPRTGRITVNSAVTPISGVRFSGGAKRDLDPIPLSLTLRQ